MFKKIILFFGLFMTMLVTAGAIYVYTSGPEITDDMERTMEAEIAAPLKEQVGQVSYAMNGETKIWYDVQSPKDTAKGTVMLVMGLSADALAWPSYFTNGFLDAGYQVIRFDNRGVGMSDWDDFNPDNPYTLSDMANDAIAILDTLKIEKVHFVGVSLGGMISQTLCIEHPERALSLTSIMSTPWIMDPELPSINMSCVKELVLTNLKYGWSKSELNVVKMGLATRMNLLGSYKYDMNVKRISQLALYNVRKRKGYNRQSGRQQTTAIEKSGSRIDALKSLAVPTLVIHGKTDPLIPFEHGLKTADLIPNADTLWIEGMGHILPEIYNDIIVDRMVKLFEKH